MQITEIQKDISTICVTASSFPNGVKEAFEKLYKLLSGFEGRTMFGISYWENGKMAYKAACSEKEAGEAKKLGSEGYTIKSGKYLSETIHNWENHMDQFNTTFTRLGHSEPATEMPGIEWYEGKDVKCMLPVKNQ